MTNLLAELLSMCMFQGIRQSKSETQSPQMTERKSVLLEEELDGQILQRQRNSYLDCASAYASTQPQNGVL